MYVDALRYGVRRSTANFVLSQSLSQALPLQALVNETMKYVHEAGGCVRRYDWHGLHGLPQRARKDGKWHAQGDLWTMWFDTNPKVLQQLNDRMRTDPRVLR